jgi:competence ComEA-like helix-hairpin-helix protein
MSISSNSGQPGGPAGRANLRLRSAMRNVFAFLVLGMLLLTGVAQAGPEGGSAPLDLNRATAVQLESLPGIGAVKAAAILAVRDSRGGFQSMEELESVRGIGPALVAKLRPLVVLGTKKAKGGKTPHK